MAEEFLIQLLKPENRINSDERQRCIMVSYLSIFPTIFFHAHAVCMDVCILDCRLCYRSNNNTPRTLFPKNQLPEETCDSNPDYVLSSV